MPACKTCGWPDRDSDADTCDECGQRHCWRCDPCEDETETEPLIWEEKPS